MRRLFITTVLLAFLPGCTVHDRTYYTIYTPEKHLTNSSPAPPVIVILPTPPQQTNAVSSRNLPEASDHQTAGVAANRSL